MQYARLFLLSVLAGLSLICTAFFLATLFTVVAEKKRPVVQEYEPLHIAVSKIDQSPEPRTWGEKRIILYPAALEYAPALPAPPMEMARQVAVASRDR
jgi:hypothetical protein